MKYNYIDSFLIFIGVTAILLRKVSANISLKINECFGFKGRNIKQIQAMYVAAGIVFIVLGILSILGLIRGK